MSIQKGAILAIAALTSTVLLVVVGVSIRTAAHSVSDDPNVVHVLRTEGEDASVRLQPGVKQFLPGSGNKTIRVQVNDLVQYQEIEGFGAALSDSSAWLISRTLPGTRNAIMNALFSTAGDGIGLNFVRVPMGASDFIVRSDYYTYDDNNGLPDPTLANFSIVDDKRYILPVLRQAGRINPDLKVMASPWSAPAWMKTNGSLTGGGSLEAEWYPAYANYFGEFVEAYDFEGVPIHAVTVQNEPLNANPFVPSMVMEPGEQRTFVKDYLGPVLAPLGTQILAWDHNWDEWSYPNEVLGDEAAASYLRGTAWHCYAWSRYDASPQSVVQNEHPDKGNYLTECTGTLDTSFANEFEWMISVNLIGATRHWARTVLLWNLALDATGRPVHDGGCANCRGVITVNDPSTFEKNAEYYALGHFSKAIVPGAKRVEAIEQTGTLQMTAFLNPGPTPTLVLVVLNASPVRHDFDVEWRGQHFSYDLPRHSAATMVWPVPAQRRVYLPRLERSVIGAHMFQDFEPGNSTPGPTCQTVWEADCWPGRLLTWQGIRSELVHAHARGTVGGDARGGTVRILPATSQPVDLASAVTIALWVYDTQGSNTVEMKLCEPNRCSPGLWSRDSAPTIPSHWSKISWAVADFSGIDKRRITSLEIYAPWDGVYYFDDIHWR